MYAAEHALRTPDRPAVVMAGSGEVLTYGDFEARANQVAHLLRHAGLGRGDHVAIFMENEPAMLLAEAGAERSGLYYTCVNSHLSPDEVAYVVDDCEARMVFAGGSLAEVAAGLPGRCPGVERFVISGSAAPAGYERWSDAVAGMACDPIEDESMGAAMLYSSGTTGRPKGIWRPLPEAAPGDRLLAHEGLKAIWRLSEEMVYLSPAPLYHSAPQANVALALRLGATVFVMERFEPRAFLELVAAHRVTHTQMVPTMFARLLRLPEEVRRLADVSSLEVVIHAAAPCPVPVKQQMIEWFGPILLEYYAATEANGFTLCDSTEWLAHRGSVGRAVVGEVLVLDDEGRPCPRGVPGTVWFKGATNFEYFRDPDKTAESRNAVGDTSTVGDVGYLDEEGYLYLTDRASHMIISGGVNIYPQETENLLASHPKVLDVAVIGVPDDDLGEAVKAVVQLVEGEEGDEALKAELVEYCRGRLAHFKCPRSVDFVDELPRSPAGKLYKRLLRERYFEGHATRLL